MPLNIPGLLVPFHLVFNPRLVIPHIVVNGNALGAINISWILRSSAQEDIRQVDFRALKRAGYKGAVFDKDNCIVRDNLLELLLKAEIRQTLPQQDGLVPELQVRLYWRALVAALLTFRQDSWRECREVFGEGNILIVSNSAGTQSDAGGLQVRHLWPMAVSYASTKHLIWCLHNTGGIRIASFTGTRPATRVSQAFIRVYKRNTRLLCFTARKQS